MKTKLLVVFFFWTVAVLSLFAQSEPTSPASPSSSYEELPELHASEILKPEFLNGPHHKVREAVPTFSGANQFTIDSDFGVFEADGNEMLVRRVAEINAIAQLKEVSRTDEFKDVLTKAAKSPVAAAKAIAHDPVTAITNVPKGIMKFMGRAGEGIKGVGKKHDSDKYEGSQVDQLIGFSDSKRKVAITLGVDPYSSNTVLQHELDGIAWASFAGAATFSLATFPIGGGAGAGLMITGTSSSFDEMLRDKSPTDLRIMNRKELIAMGASAADVERFLDNGAFSPSAQTAFVFNLKALKGVTNRGAFVCLAGKTSSAEADAIFCVQTAALMAKLHQNEKPLARIALIGDFPICIAEDATPVVALQWDYAAWTPGAEKFADAVKAKTKANTPSLVALSGMVSPRLRQELEFRGSKVQDRLMPGPLK